MRAPSIRTGITQILRARAASIFQPHDVCWIIKAPPLIWAGHTEQPIADQRKQHLAGAHCLIDDLDKVVTWLD
jgi:hypothetical protein